MNSISIGPLVFANDRFVAVLTIIAFLVMAEIAAWRKRGSAEAIRRWSGATLVVWIVTARLGYVVAHWEAFAPAPLSVFAIWQGGFSSAAGTFGAGATLFAAFLRQRGAGLPVLISAIAAASVFKIGSVVLPDDVRGRIPAAGFADMSGAPVSLNERDGQPLVLNLWATWCPPCRREMPMMVDVAQSQASSETGAEIVFANQGEQVGTIRQFLQLTDLPEVGMIRDPNNALMEKFKLMGLPSTLFFAADGTLQAVHTGEISRAALLAGITDLQTESDAD
ncbi:prolipoprotein diacylglyceryl transferase family protein [Roseovarius sp. S4756]|uniref:prolipoprotein diacylglyceryl transferase family protein n=1 Tax=Roseovarius maritimus TaxID=3342637 RepID=UPI0037294603